MLILKIDSKRPDTTALKRAAAILNKGGLIVYPTETAYALGCDPKNTRAVKRLFSVKKRDRSKALPLIASSRYQASKFTRSDIFTRILMDAFWPGALTLVIPVRTNLKSANIHDREDLQEVEIAIRVSSHPWALALAKAFGAPIVSTSANLSGHRTPYAITSVLRDLGTLPDLVLDAGPLPKTKPSTIVQPAGGVIRILRQGPISEDDLHRALMRSL